MSPQDYDAWYRTPRGAWIGDAEHALLRGMLGAERGASLLDVGCGTGYFSRRFARDGCVVTGADLDPGMVKYAQAHAAGSETYCVADAQALPFDDQSFDYCVSVTALCFAQDERKALAEMVRVARRGIALGLLNRRSLLYWQKGRHGGSGAYRGARWHAPAEARTLAKDLPLKDLVLRSAIFIPSGSSIARAAEDLLPDALPCGGFLAAAAATARRG
jgi:SAM-dependent methyltransferase